MPWDEAVLAVADIGADGSAGRSRRIAGGKGTAASEPVWMAERAAAVPVGPLGVRQSVPL